MALWTPEEQCPKERKQQMPGEGGARRTEGRGATKRGQVMRGFVGYVRTRGFSERNEKPNRDWNRRVTRSDFGS